MTTNAWQIQLTSVWPLIQSRNIETSIWLNFDSLLLSWFLRFWQTKITAIMKILGLGVFVFHVKNNRIFKTDFNTIQKVSKLCEV